jgi:hypothetical protein
MKPFINPKEQENSIFDFNPNTLLGKNEILNFLGKISFEIREFGYSPSANEIAEFYDNCTDKKTFTSNVVVKFILDEIEYMPNVKKYLYDRFFNQINQESIKRFENTYKNNEQITKIVDKGEEQYKLQQDLKNKQIDKLSKLNNISYKEAEILLKQHEDLNNIIKDLFGKR